MKRSIRVWSALSLGSLALLALACGGGGGDSSSAVVSNTGGAASSPSSTLSSSANYTLTFVAEWSASTHDQVPNAAHFSPLIGLTHSAEAAIWSTGNLSSAGMKLMAETGGTSTLGSEIDTLIASGKGGVKLGGLGSLNSPGNQVMSFSIESGNALVSVVSMIAPSPDWFIGTAGANLLDGNGNFVAVKTVDLFPYDAGTDSGSSFTATDAVTSPAEPISAITGPSFQKSGTLTRLGQFVFTRQ